MGTIPPITQSDWQEVFTKYQQFPEYKMKNFGMTLEEFKGIFLWEYGHRVLGRFIGLLFLLPFLFFIWKKWIRGSEISKLLLIFILGGAQGLLGWYMVKSGLVNRPEVSHYRLAAHLSLALFLLGAIYWTFLDYGVRLRKPKLSYGRPPVILNRLSWIVLSLLGVQIFYGAFMAGLDGGLIFNTFPLMNGYVFPPGALAMSPTWVNVFENAVAVQWVHRVLGFLLVILIAAMWLIGAKNTLNRPQKISLNFLLFVTLLQFCLGVGTLLFRVPVPLASLHQIGASVLILLCLNAIHKFKVE